MARNRSVVALLALSCLPVLPAPAASQTDVTCTANESIARCYTRVVTGRTVDLAAADSAVTDSAAAGATGDEREDLRGKTAGPDLPATVLASAIRDFLPRFAGSLVAPGPTDDATSLALRTNIPLLLNDGVLSTWGLTAQLGATIHEAEPFGTLVDSVAESSRETVRTRLQEGMEPYDDVSLTGAFNFESRGWGRSFRSHERTVQGLTSELLRFGDEERRAAARAYFSFVGRLGAAALDPRAGAGCALGQNGVLDIPLSCLTPEVQVQVLELIGRAAGSQAVWRRRAEQRLRESGFNYISELINNQPQFNTTVEYRARSEFAGPDEWTGKARFEYSRANMNRLRSFCTGLRGKDTVDLGCLQQFTRGQGVRGSLSRGGRFWTEAALNHRPTYRALLADESVDFSLASATTLAVSGGYGAYFGNPADGANRDRLDLQGKYDFTRDDVLRQDRMVVTAFYTRHLSDQSSVLLGLTWANKAEFVGDVDRHFGANLGLTYKLHQPDKEEAQSGSGEPR